MSAGSCPGFLTHSAICKSSGRWAFDPSAGAHVCQKGEKTRASGAFNAEGQQCALDAEGQVRRKAKDINEHPVPEGIHARGHR